MTASPYTFAAVRAADLPLLARWRRMPHVIEWWDEPDAEPEAETLAEGKVAMWIVAHEGRPFAYAQDYSPHDWLPHLFAHLPPRSRGIDQYIGEPDMLARGHGSAFARLHCEPVRRRRAPSAPIRTRTTSAPSAYEKAGFAAGSGVIDTRWAPILMECRR